MQYLADEAPSFLTAARSIVITVFAILQYSMKKKGDKKR
jgi:hypothetical protein